MVYLLRSLELLPVSLNLHRGYEWTDRIDLDAPIVEKEKMCYIEIFCQLEKLGFESYDK